MSDRRRPSAPRLAATLLGAAALLAGGLAVGPARSQPAAAQEQAAPTALFIDVPGQARVTGSRGAVAGTHRLVTVDTARLPAEARGQRLSVPLGRTTASVRLERVDREPAYVAWSGRLEDEALSSFTLVRADGVLTGALVSPAGTWSLRHAGDQRYWWTSVAARTEPEGSDAAAAPRPRAGEPRPAPATDARAARKVRIGVMFGFTKNAKAEMGGKAEVKAAAALVLAQTNEAMRNSGIKVKLRYKGLVKARGTESLDPVKDAFRVSRPRDGRFDNLQRVRRRKGGDLIHLLASGPVDRICGGGLIPTRPQWARPSVGASVSWLSCMPYLVATHEIGHNLGADHIDYPGVSHDSLVPGSYGYFNVPGNYITAMGYYAPCEDAGIYTCVRIPWFSSPSNTYLGQPLGVGRATNNSRVIRMIAPRVARYVR